MKKTDDEYFDSKEFQDLLETYEHSVNAGEPVFMDAEELSDIADYYQFIGQADEAEDRTWSYCSPHLPHPSGPV